VSFWSTFSLGQKQRTQFHDYEVMKGVGHGRIVYTG